MDTPEAMQAGFLVGVDMCVRKTQKLLASRINAETLKELSAEELLKAIRKDLERLLKELREAEVFSPNA